MCNKDLLPFVSIQNAADRRNRVTRRLERNKAYPKNTMNMSTNEA